MVHLAFPRVAKQHHWIEEGLATYIEPWARLGIGQLTEETVWKDLVEGLPKGLPGPEDKGLDRTPTWGRTYWGGALFCLLADVEIRKRTANQRGLHDAVRGIVAAGGSMREQWSLTRTLEIGDQATGVSVLTELYEQMKETPTNVDLADLWQQLGIEVRDGAVVFHADAPLASVREAITRSAEERSRLGVTCIPNNNDQKGKTRSERMLRVDLRAKTPSVSAAQLYDVPLRRFPTRLVRSCIKDRSSSARTPTICHMARPVCVSVSIASGRDLNLIPLPYQIVEQGKGEPVPAWLAA